MREAAVNMGHLMMNSPTLNATPRVTIRSLSMEMRQSAQRRSRHANKTAKRRERMGSFSARYQRTFRGSNASRKPSPM